MRTAPPRPAYATCTTCTGSASPPTAREYATLGYLFLLTLLAVALPPLVQPEAYHQFADQRAVWGIARGADVLTNLIFAAVGVLGLLRLARGPSLDATTRTCLAVFFGGVAATAAGSAYYHFAPTSASLLWDRAPMIVAFAGLLGAFCTQQVSRRAGVATVTGVLSLGLASLIQAAGTGSVSAYVVLQFGGLLGMVMLLAANTRSAAPRSAAKPLPSLDSFAWGALLGWYALAKVLELGDVVIWEATGYLVSGHSLKHLAAGMAALAIARSAALKPAPPKFVA